MSLPNSAYFSNIERYSQPVDYERFKDVRMEADFSHQSTPVEQPPKFDLPAAALLIRFSHPSLVAAVDYRLGDLGNNFFLAADQD